MAISAARGSWRGYSRTQVSEGRLRDEPVGVAPGGDQQLPGGLGPDAR